MKRVLIIGRNSYIGESLKNWLDQFEGQYFTEIITAINNAWKETDFSKFDSIVDFARIAHINNITEDMRDLFFSVN